MATTRVMMEPTKAIFIAIKNSMASVSIVMIKTEFQRTRSLTFSIKPGEGTSLVSVLTALNTAFKRRKLMIGPINVIMINAASEKSTHGFPHPHVEITRYRPGSRIKITLKGSRPSSFTANADQIRMFSVFVEWSMAIIAVKVIPTAANMMTAPKICRNKTKLYNKTPNPPFV